MVTPMSHDLVIPVPGASNGPHPEEEMGKPSVPGRRLHAVENPSARDAAYELGPAISRGRARLEDATRRGAGGEEIIGTSAVLRAVLDQVSLVASTDSTVLIHGETGTGKELIARAIHDLSPRRTHALVKLNCAAIPSGLLESEMFGHEVGAFTGALGQRIGRFELANRGTVFLDEVGEIPLELQPKLLRVLQEREFERLGSSRTMRTDARVVAATNRDLATLVDEQRFRADLYYRLDVFPIRVPALRERPEDIPLLAQHFVRRFARRLDRTVDTVPSEAMDALVRYPWPGNIREMQNLIERAVILSPGRVLRMPLQDLRPDVTRQPQAPALPGSLADAERAHILAVLKETGCVLSGPRGAASRLGMNRSTLQFRMKKLGITRRVVMHGPEEARR
jgi:formate hydrogenlyase transcriptional activator